MKQKIGFWNEIQGNADNITRPKDETPLAAPKKSLVQVYFPKRGMNLSYYNDRFDLQVGDTVYVDGKPLDEPYIPEEMYLPYSADMQNTHWEVPEGSIFVMGDNRNHSSDSRSDTVGMVDERQVIGRALWRLFPLGSFGRL